MTKTILVVDDDKLIREGLAAMLRNNGHQVVEATNGNEGLTAALQHHPDLILSDVRMPGLDGLAMVEQIRSDDWGKHVPVIILSNDEAPSTINGALLSGVTVYLSKVNLEPETLGQQILLALGSSA